MAVDQGAGPATGPTKKAVGKVAQKAKATAGRTAGPAKVAPRSTTATGKKATTTAKKATRSATDKAKKATRSATRTTEKATRSAAETAKSSAEKAAATAKATVAARQGRADDARRIAAEAGLDEGRAVEAIAEVASMHYDVEVNKRRLNVGTLAETLNARWENGWKLAHVLEQRGNTVLVYEKRT